MSTLIELPAISAGAKRTVSIDLTDDLDTAELGSGTPTTDELGTTDLTLANQTINAAIVVIRGENVAIGKAAQFSVDALNVVAGVTYSIKLTVATGSSPAERLVYDLQLPCE